MCAAARYSLLIDKDPEQVRNTMPWRLHVNEELWAAAIDYPVDPPDPGRQPLEVSGSYPKTR